MKKILILNAHPHEKSLSNALANRYFEGAKASGFEVKIINLRDLKFDPILHGGYIETTELEDDLKKQQELIKWCNHLVIVTPLWWTQLPALLKGYFDRVFLPGFAFKFNANKPMQEKLLGGRTATVIYTQGAPFWFTLLFYSDCFWVSLKRGILEFCGFSNVKRVVFDIVPHSTEEKRKKWLKRSSKWGQKENKQAKK